MSRLSTMSRFEEPDEKEETPKLVDRCHHCGSYLFEGMEAFEFADYLFCDTSCLGAVGQYKILGGN